MKKQHVIPFIVIGIFCFCIIGICSADSANPVTFILKSGDDPFWNQIRTGIEEASLEYNIPVTILTPETSCQSDDMIVLAFDALSESPSILVIAPSDITLFNPALKAAANDEIPVFVLESPLTNEILAGYVGSDNEAIGILAADDLASMLNGDGIIAVLSRSNQDPASIIRAEAFIKQIENNHSEIEITPYSPDNDTELNLYIESLLADNPDIKGIFSTDGDTTLALGLILKELGLKGSIAVVGVDGSDEAKTFVTDGIIQEIIAQDPYTIGYNAVKILDAFIQGESISPSTYIDFVTYVSDIPFATTVSPTPTATKVPEVTPSSTPTNNGSDESLSYEQRLQAASSKYDFNSMTEQNSASHYSTVNQIARNQAALSASSSASSGRSGHWCPTCGAGLVWVP